MSAVDVVERIKTLCGRFRLATVATEVVPRFRAAHQAAALGTLVEVLELEAADRDQRRVDRLRRAAKLPAGKTLETLERERLPLKLQQQLDELARGEFLERSVNVLAFGLPGTGKSHALAALGHRLVEQGHSVRFARALRKLDQFEVLVLDDLGYLKHQVEEAEVLFTLIAERYERRSLALTSNVVFSQWQEIFQSPMATAAAIDRVVHHSVILEFDVPSYRTAEAKATRQTPGAARAGGSGRRGTEKNAKRSPGARTRRKAGAQR
jgi:DNA replication protein DnaC